MRGDSTIGAERSSGAQPRDGVPVFRAGEERSDGREVATGHAVAGGSGQGGPRAEVSEKAGGKKAEAKVRF